MKTNLRAQIRELVELHLKKLLPGQDFEFPEAVLEERTLFFKKEIKDSKIGEELPDELPLVLGMSSLIIENFAFQFFALFKKSQLIFPTVEENEKIIDLANFPRFEYLHGHGQVSLKRPDQKFEKFLEKLELLTSDVGTILETGEIIEPYTTAKLTNKNVKIKIDNQTIELPHSLNKPFFTALFQMLSEYYFHTKGIVPQDKVKKRSSLQLCLKIAVLELLPLIKELAFKQTRNTVTNGNHRFIAGLVLVSIGLLRDRESYENNPYKKGNRKLKNDTQSKKRARKNETKPRSKYYAYLTKSVWNSTER